MTWSDVPGILIVGGIVVIILNPYHVDLRYKTGYLHNKVPKINFGAIGLAMLVVGIGLVVAF